MKLTGLHFLLTYQCTFECEHCFVWGSPWQEGTMSLKDIRTILQQAQELGTVKWIYYEGGEPMLYYPILVRAVQIAHEMGFQVGVVSNAYWANSLEDALEWLRPFSGLVDDLSVSSDLLHYKEKLSKQAKNASAAAEQLGITLGILSIAQPEESGAETGIGQLPSGESGIMYRGRAAQALAPRAPHHAWDQFTECPYEDLRDPGRIHVDPLGYLHICQGITIGNLFTTQLSEIIAGYDPEAHPIINALLAGGPEELVSRNSLPHQDRYADACHLCYEARLVLREKYPTILAPDQVYGVYG